MIADDNQTNEDPLVAKFMRRLRAYCEEERGRPRRLAAELGVEPASVYDWLSGRTTPALKHTLRIQQILARHKPRRSRKDGIQ